MAKDVATQILTAHVVIAAHHHRRVQVPSVDVGAQPFATLVEPRIVVIGKHLAMLIDSTELSDPEAQLSA